MKTGSAAPSPFYVKKKLSRQLNLNEGYVKLLVIKIMTYMWSHQRPTYIGQLSLEAGLSIERTEILIEHLIKSGSIKKLSNDEVLAAGYNHGGIMVVLSGTVPPSCLCEP